ncbi:hypothetical protein B1810_14340 [Panacagrimonas perspica]|uniref:universal stress protein n=1 Tax=Panacagrimonas perspica TaxID=381431 RepID=UPI0011362BC2|nr:universal stress protein [Panacagrimonas perspica]THD02500.1 hypothetical protein B1810_14340 [Panacagrimonas perspica]
MQSVLVALDLTPDSDRVIGRVALLPLAHAAQVTLLHVVPSGLMPRERMYAEREAVKLLSREAEHWRERLRGNVKIASIVKIGTAAKDIAKQALQSKSDLIVMGRGRGRPLRDAILGSTAERVIRQARVPVLAVRLAPRAEYRRPTLALDLDPVAEDIVRLALRVLPARRPPLDVIHAFDDLYESRIYKHLNERETEERKELLRAKALHDISGVFGAALAKAETRPEEGGVGRVGVRPGPPRSVVEEHVKTIEADLLVVGTRGYSGAAYMLFGTVSGDLLRATKCDVLIVPPSAARST